MVLLLVIDFGAGQVLLVDPTKDNNNAEPCITLPAGNQFPTSGLNGITFDAAGNVYISDSFQGIIWRLLAEGAGDNVCETHAQPRSHRQRSAKSMS